MNDIGRKGCRAVFLESKADEALQHARDAKSRATLALVFGLIAIAVGTLTLVLH